MRKELLVFLGTMFKSHYINQNELDSKYLFDNDVNDCLIKMYLTIISDDLEYDKRLKLFIDSYEKLNLEQQEYIRNDYLNIINAQNENKEKVLRKE